MTPILSRIFFFLFFLAGKTCRPWGMSRSDSMGEGSITVPGATAFLEWKFINNARLDNKKNSPAVSHSTALSKGQAISLKSQKKNNKLLDATEGLFFFLAVVVFAGSFLTRDNGGRWRRNGLSERIATLDLNCEKAETSCFFDSPKRLVRPVRQTTVNI